ncbi:MAG: ribulokinase [Clostridiaceae bacterium]|nr:ribulokinase [Bacillota bacterium]NLP07283.1 ribulokinase [Clostridiaceae bacterium]HOA54141.1 ribulokinase [Clostridiales bacterium]
MRNLVAGADFGSDSVRVIIIDALTGERVAKAVAYYPRWQKQMYCDAAANQFRQHPLDYIESFTACMREAMAQTGSRKGDLCAIAVDTTGSTPCPVDDRCTPLAMLDEFSDDPDAMFHLWKDHTAVEEAKEINHAFSNAKMDYTMYQGIYSSEWYWAKILRTVRANERVRQAAWTWLEHSDWIPALLTGNTDPNNLYRGSTGAGHKALWNSHFGGLPDRDCLGSLDPYLALIYDRYNTAPKPAGTRLGVITREWAEKLGVPQDTIIGGGSFDAHAGAVGAGVRPGTMVKVVGTSTVDMLVEDKEKLEGKDLRAYCGLAEDSIVPGYIGIEASQAAFGDVYAWFSSLLMWPLNELVPGSGIISDDSAKKLIEDAKKKIIRELETRAEQIEDVDITALDWFNGRRYPFLNENAIAAISGLSLGSTAPEIYRALAEATVFGSRRVFEGFIENGINVERIIMVGGIAKKSPFIMQMMADVLERPVMVSQEEQVPALGAAIYAAVAAGFYPDVTAAQDALCEPYKDSFLPNAEKSEKYNEKYQKYLALGDFIDKF